MSLHCSLKSKRVKVTALRWLVRAEVWSCQRKFYTLAMVVHTWEGSQNNGYFPSEARDLSLTSGDPTLETEQKREVPKTPALEPLGNMIPLGQLQKCRK